MTENKVLCIVAFVNNAFRVAIESAYFTEEESMSDEFVIKRILTDYYSLDEDDDVKALHCYDSAVVQRINGWSFRPVAKTMAAHAKGETGYCEFTQAVGFEKVLWEQVGLPD